MDNKQKQERQKLIEQALDGKLSTDEQRQFDLLFAEDERFANQVNRRVELASLVKSNTSDSFSAFFVDRLMKNLAPEDALPSSESLLQSLLWTFKRVAVASAFVVVALLSLNTLNSEESNQSLVEMAFDIPVVSIDAALDDFGLIEP